MNFLIHRRPRGLNPPDLTGQRLGLCVVDSKAPSVTNNQRWRIRCNAITAERDQCGELFYLETYDVRRYQKPGHELYACSKCRTARRAATSIVRFSCEACSAQVEMSRKNYKRRSKLVKEFCPHCAVKAGRTHAAGGRLTGLAKANERRAAMNGQR